MQLKSLNIVAIILAVLTTSQSTLLCAEIIPEETEMGVLLQVSPQVVVKTRLDVPDNISVSSQLDVVQWVEFTRAFPSGTLIAVEQSSLYPWQLQSLDPSQANHVSVKADIEVKAKTIRRDIFPGLGPGSPFVVILELTSEISSGQSIGIRYSNLQMPETSYDEFALPLQISLDKHFHAIEVDTFTIAPGPAKTLMVSAPSIIGSSELFDAKLLVMDEAGNPINGGTPSFEVLIDGVFSRRLSKTTSPRLVIKDLVFEKPGLHKIDIRSSGGSLRGSSNIVYVTDNRELDILWSDFHLHKNGHTTKGGFSSGALKERLKTPLDLLSIPGSLHSSSIVSSEFYRPLSQGGNMILVNNEYQIALGDVPLDHRRLDIKKPIMAEIIAGSSQYEWLGKRFADLGYKISFVGSQSSHLPGSPIGNGKSALLVRAGEDWRTAFDIGRTYVVSEGKPILLMTINDADPGMRVPFSARREIKGEVHASYGIHTVELIRNGVVVDSRKPGISADTNVIQIKMSSPNQPLAWDLPRNGREWIGYIKSSKSSIRDISSKQYGDMHNMASYSGDSSRLDFITWTHGGSRNFLVEVLGDDQKDSLEFAIMAGFEDIITLPKYRDPAATPSIRQVFSLETLRSNKITRTFETYGYKDEIDISLVDRQLPSSYKFEFVDLTDIKAGDYYYLRVTGEEGEMIWSSPVYIGGFDVKK